MLLLPCDQSDRWNVTGNGRNISIYSRSRMIRLKQLYGPQLSVCTDVTGRGGRPSWSNPPSQVGQASWELCAVTTKRRACLCFVPGEQSGRVCTASVTWVWPGHQECLMPASFPEICSGARTSGGNLTGGVRPGAAGGSLWSTSRETGKGSS